MKKKCLMVVSLLLLVFSWGCATKQQETSLRPTGKSFYATPAEVDASLAAAKAAIQQN